MTWRAHDILVGSTGGAKTTGIQEQVVDMKQKVSKCPFSCKSWGGAAEKQNTQQMNSPNPGNLKYQKCEGLCLDIFQTRFVAGCHANLQIEGSQSIIAWVFMLRNRIPLQQVFYQSGSAYQSKQYFQIFYSYPITVAHRVWEAANGIGITPWFVYNPV